MVGFVQLMDVNIPKIGHMGRFHDCFFNLYYSVSTFYIWRMEFDVDIIQR